MTTPIRSGPPEPDAEAAGAGVVNATFLGTAVLLVASVAGALAPDPLGVPVAGVSVGLFVVGVAGLLYGYGTGVVRSRDEAVTLVGLFFLSGSAPAVVAFRLRLALAVQVVVAVAAAAVRPYTAVAFVVLGPMFGLGQLAVWGARHGTFGPRDDPRAASRGRTASDDVDGRDGDDGVDDATAPRPGGSGAGDGAGRPPGDTAP